jgi:hypothetical protein
MPTRYVPPSGFGYPPDGFLPQDPCRFCFTPAALLGFTLRRFSLRAGIRGVTTRINPHTVQPRSAPAAEAPGRPEGPRFPGIDPPESPWRSDKGLACRTLDPPLGFTLPGFSTEALAKVPPGLLSRALRTRRSLADLTGASEFRSASASPRPCAALGT